MKNYLGRFKNVGTVISVVSLLGLLLIQFGVEVDMAWLDTTIKIVCSLGVALGIMNNPETPGIDLPRQNIPKEINPGGETTEFRK